MGVCIKCGRPLGEGDYDGWCGMCDYCPRCHEVVDQLNIYQDEDGNGYCTWCKNDYLAEKQAQLELALTFSQDDEDDIDDEHENDSLFGKSQVLELSQDDEDDIDDEYEEDDIISILKSIVKIAFYLALLLGVLIAVIAIMMRRK